jgi:hypothetical protein
MQALNRRGAETQRKYDLSRIRKVTDETNIVIAGLVPATHEHEMRWCSWMAGTSPAMTAKGDGVFSWRVTIPMRFCASAVQSSLKTSRTFAPGH